MPCIEAKLNEMTGRRISGLFGAALAAMALGLAGCGSVPSGSPAAPPAAPAAAPAPAAAGGGKLAAPTTARNWNEFKVLAARRIVAANPNGTYMGKPQQMLLAIPVLEIELNGDGSIRHIDVMRRPSQAPETIQLAIDAVRRAAPFGSVAHLPKPWKFAEVFLFNDDKRFKPRTLDAE